MFTTSRGLFISLEGLDGSGKSTQLKLLVERLRGDGLTVAENQEPGGTPIGAQIRRILLDPANHELTSMAELLLMFASRAQSAAEIIEPALQRGEVVVSDRYTDSTLAYQGAGRGLDREAILNLHRLSVGNLLPDITLFIDVDLETSLRRASARNRGNRTLVSEARIDEQSADFHERVRHGYFEIAEREPQRFRIIDGRRTIDQVAAEVWAEIATLLSKTAI